MSDTVPVTGSDIVGALLLASPALLALVPADHIAAARLPDGLPLPLIVVELISTTNRQPLKRGRFVRRTDRITVNVRTASHADRTRAMHLVGLACAGRTGTIAGAERVSVVTAGSGPELNGPGDSYDQGRDFLVSFDEPTS